MFLSQKSQVCKLTLKDLASLTLQIGAESNCPRSQMQPDSQEWQLNLDFPPITLQRDLQVSEPVVFASAALIPRDCVCTK